MVYVVNYANDKYKSVQKLNTKTAYKFGADKVLSFGPENIEKSFYEKHKKILDIKRGNGLWLWKPYIINRVLNELEENDILMYCDSGAFFIGNIKKVTSYTEKYDMIVFDIPLIEKQFTKSEAFFKMKCTEKRYYESNQVIATYFCVKNTPAVRKFMKEWLMYCCDYDVIGPAVKDKEKSYFISHREDQSVFSLLCKKYEIPVFKDISQRRLFPKSYKNDKNYIYKKTRHNTPKLPLILYLHKFEKLTLWKLIKQIIKHVFSIFR